MYDKLLSPVKIGSWELSSRVIMPPLTRSRAQPDWTPNDAAPEYYGQRNTAGLVICEATQVSPDASGYPRTPGIWTDKHTAKWAEIVKEIHKGTAKAVLQLWHTGRIAHPDNLPDGLYPMGPSAVQPELPIYTDKAGTLVENPVPREMTEADVLGVIESYRKACANAKKAGFDGVELHGANGYIVDQFASTNTNLRTDKWGGTLEKRVRFMGEVLKAMMSVFPKDCVGVRLSPYSTFNCIDDANPLAKYEAMLDVAQKAGVGYIHIIRPVVSGNIQMEASSRDLEVLEIARKHFKGSIIAAANFTPDSAEETLNAGLADAVAFGRPFVGNPDLVRRIREGLPIVQSDQDTWYTPDLKGYNDYPNAESLQSQVQKILDREEIRNLRVRYSHILDSGKMENFGDVFTQDAVVEVSVGKMEGLEAIKKGLAGAYETFDYRKAKHYPFMHAVTNHSITITGPDSAEGLCYLLDWVTGREKGHPVLLLGLYADKYKRINGKWKIYHTNLDVVWQHEDLRS